MSSISLFTTPQDLDQLDKETLEIFNQTQKKLGFLPNFFLLMARRPLECKTFINHYLAIMEKKNSSLTKNEKELIVVAVSGFNHCHYCATHHGAFLRIYEKNPYISDQIVLNYNKADLTLRQKSMLDFAIKINKEAEVVGESDFKTMKENGFDEEDIWDIMSISSFMAMANRMANVSGIKPNLEFYNLGRNVEGEKNK